jgi:hypothetical protein
MNEERIKEVFSDEAFVKELFSKETPEEVQAMLEDKDIELSIDEIVKLKELLEKKVENPDAELVELVSDIKKLRSEITIGTTNSFGTGGMETKLEAAEKVVSYDIPMVLANGGVSNVLTRLVDGSGKGTLFIPSENQ